MKNKILIVLLVLLVGVIGILIVYPHFVSNQSQPIRLNVTKGKELTDFQVMTIQSKDSNDRIYLTEVIEGKTIIDNSEKFTDYEQDIKEQRLLYNIASNDTILKESLAYDFVIDKGIYNGYIVEECGFINRTITVNDYEYQCNTKYNDTLKSNQEICRDERTGSHLETYKKYICRPMGETQELDKISIKPDIGVEILRDTQGNFLKAERKYDVIPKFSENDLVYIDTSKAWFNETFDIAYEIETNGTTAHENYYWINGSNGIFGKVCFYTPYKVTGTIYVFANSTTQDFIVSNESTQLPLDCVNNTYDYTPESVYSDKFMHVHEFETGGWNESTGNLEPSTATGTPDLGGVGSENCQIGNCIGFVADGEHLTLYHNATYMDLNGDHFTIMMFVNMDSIGDAQTIFSQRDGNDEGINDYYSETNSDQVQVQGTTDFSETVTIELDNVVSLYALEFDTPNQNVTFYKNGTQFDERNEGASWDVYDDGDDFRLADWGAYPAKGYDGYLDSFRVYNGTMNETHQKSILYNSLGYNNYLNPQEATAAPGTTTTSSTSTTTTTVPGGFNSTNCTRYKCPVDTYVNKQFDCGDVLKYHCTLNLSNVTINATGVLGLNTTSGILGEIKFI